MGPKSLSKKMSDFEAASSFGEILGFGRKFSNFELKKRQKKAFLVRPVTFTYNCHIGKVI